MSEKLSAVSALNGRLVKLSGLEERWMGTSRTAGSMKAMAVGPLTLKV
jgi:hypothetical protein